MPNEQNVAPVAPKNGPKERKPIVLPFGRLVFGPVDNPKTFKGDNGTFSRKLVMIHVFYKDSELGFGLALSANWKAGDAKLNTRIQQPMAVGSRFAPALVTSDAATKEAFNAWLDDVKKQAIKYLADRVKNGEAINAAPTPADDAIDPAELGLSLA